MIIPRGWASTYHRDKPIDKITGSLVLAHNLVAIWELWYQMIIPRVGASTHHCDEPITWHWMIIPMGGTNERGQAYTELTWYYTSLVKINWSYILVRLIYAINNCDLEQLIFQFHISIEYGFLLYIYIYIYIYMRSIIRAWQRYGIELWYIRDDLIIHFIL